MTFFEIVQDFRFFNAVIGLAGFVWITLKANYHWHHYDLNTRIFVMVIILFSFTVTYASGEAAQQDSPAGLRTFFVTAANLTLLWGMWRTRGRISTRDVRPGAQ